MRIIYCSESQKPYRLLTTYPIFGARDEVVELRSVWEDARYFETYGLAAFNASKLEEHDDTVTVDVVDALGRRVVPDLPDRVSFHDDEIEDDIQF